jgi:hypothetical protein
MRIKNRFGPDDELPNLASLIRYDVAVPNQADPHFIAFPVFHRKDGTWAATSPLAVGIPLVCGAHRYRRATE